MIESKTPAEKVADAIVDYVNVRDVRYADLAKMSGTAYLRLIAAIDAALKTAKSE